MHFVKKQVSEKRQYFADQLGAGAFGACLAAIGRAGGAFDIGSGGP